MARSLMPISVSLPPLRLPRSSLPTAGASPLANQARAAFSVSLRQFVGLHLVDLRTLEDHQPGGQVEGGDFQPRQLAETQAVIEQQAHQQGIAASLGRVRLRFEHSHLRLVQRHGLGLLDAFAGRGSSGAAFFIDLLLLFVLIAGDGANERVLLGAQGSRLKRQLGILFDRRELDVDRADSVPILEQPGHEGGNQSLGDIRPGFRIVVELLGVPGDLIVELHLSQVLGEGRQVIC